MRGGDGWEWDGGVTYGVVVGLEVGSETGGTLRGWWEVEGEPGGHLRSCWKEGLWLGGSLGITRGALEGGSGLGGS